MSLAQKLGQGLAQQLANPRGRAGRLLGRAMDFANRHPLHLAVDLLDIRPGEDVLDAGCGTGAALAEMRRRGPGSLTGVDRSATMLKMAQGRLRDGATQVLGDLTAMPLPDRAFDAALALNVLYFDDAQRSIVRELHRVLRPGGRLVAYVTHAQTMDGWAFTGEGLHRLYDADALRAALVEGGFAQPAVRVHEVAVTRSVRGLLVCARREG
ncbi:Methyltransferase domain-containing protein [Novosphingobium sp. CF614]|uniref:class I SAM-dependent methyltransferase n=1 Tax=Novosphingobium sp. CF614 TaxID=1884364 RepID=UPI0008DF8324|nr:methyltransferase domain-containing protein [Novosphingobium sp. CF614]SFG16783.1 Methyltransferase domain-containing protein [Novosphingobium sp. CF614]